MMVEGGYGNVKDISTCRETDDLKKKGDRSDAKNCSFFK